MTKESSARTASQRRIENSLRSTVDKIESRRWHLLWLVSDKWTIKEAAAIQKWGWVTISERQELQSGEDLAGRSE